MMRQKHYKVAALFTALMSVAGFWWACDFERVGPKEPSVMKLADILAELENGQTQVQAEMAIQHLLEKTGVGIEVRGSRYGEYVLTDNFVPRLAQKHLQYVQRAPSNLTWGEMFKIEKILSGDEWSRPVEFQEAVSRLQEQAAAAQNDPENPNHALLLALVAKDAAVPAPIPVYDETAIISPMQEFLFEVWAQYEFGGFASEQKSAASGTVTFKIVTVTCDGDLLDDIIVVTHTKPFTSKKQKKCLQKARKEYNEEVEDCFDDHYDDDDCPDLKDCLEEALEELEEDLEECHDQGGGH